MEMRRILVQKRRAPTIAVDRAILKSLEAAFDFQLAHLRYRFLKTREAQADTTLPAIVMRCCALYPQPAPALWPAWPPTGRLSAAAWPRPVRDEAVTGYRPPTDVARSVEGPR